jgi:hypothetical protein
VRDPSRWPRDTPLLYPQTLASDGLSVVIVRLRTRGHGVCLFFCLFELGRGFKTLRKYSRWSARSVRSESRAYQADTSSTRFTWTECSLRARGYTEWRIPFRCLPLPIRTHARTYAHRLRKCVLNFGKSELLYEFPFTFANKYFSPRHEAHYIRKTIFFFPGNSRCGGSRCVPYCGLNLHGSLLRPVHWSASSCNMDAIKLLFCVTVSSRNLNTSRY